MKPDKDALSNSRFDLDWWEARHWRNNKGIIIVGLLAFVGYAIVGSQLPLGRQ